MSIPRASGRTAVTRRQSLLPLSESYTPPVRPHIDTFTVQVVRQNVRVLNALRDEAGTTSLQRAERLVRCGKARIKPGGIEMIRTDRLQEERELKAMARENSALACVSNGMNTRAGIKGLPIAGEVTDLTLRRRAVKR